jgi:hypothetical protein
MAGFNSTGTFGFSGGSGFGYPSPTKICTIASGTSVIDTSPRFGFNSAFYQFSVTDCTNYYAGNFVAVWDATTGQVQFTETSTSSIGSTTGVSLSFECDTDTANLIITVPTADWKFTFVKTILTDCCTDNVEFLITEIGDYLITESGLYLVTE